jgi:hypothetical protein
MSQQHFMNMDYVVQQLHWTDRQTDRQHVLGGIVSITGMLVASSVSQSLCFFVGVGNSSTSTGKT